MTPEVYFVYNFIQKEKQERLLNELSSPGRRTQGLSRFCHTAKDYLDEEKIQNIALEKFISENDAAAVILSSDPYLDLKKGTLKAMADLAGMMPGEVILMTEKTAIVFEETEKGGRSIYCLKV